MTQNKPDPKIVAYTKDGIPLPALPWSDDPKHALGQRAMDEDNSRSYEVLVEVVAGLGLFQACKKQKCKRLKKCCGFKIVKSGRRQGLYEGYPDCFTDFREPIRDILMECDLEQK
jgi:hypothetical protein